MTSKNSFEENLKTALSDIFDQLSLGEDIKKNELYVHIDNKVVTINLSTFATKCDEDKQLEQSVSTVVNQIKNLS